MARSSWVIAGVAAGVLAVLLVGAVLLLGGREPVGSGDIPPEAAATTVLRHPPDPSDGSDPPDPFPTVSSAQLRGDGVSAWLVRTADGGRRLLVQVTESDCSREEVRLLGEHADRVELDVRTVTKPPPPGASVGPDGSYGCMAFSPANGPYAVIDLRAPLGDRPVVIRRAP